MAKSKTPNTGKAGGKQKKAGRPQTLHGKTTLVGVRLEEPHLEKLDKMKGCRAVAVRRLIDKADAASGSIVVCTACASYYCTKCWPGCPTCAANDKGGTTA